jgi:hypothetical protein
MFVVSALAWGCTNMVAGTEPVPRSERAILDATGVFNVHTETAEGAYAFDLLLRVLGRSGLSAFLEVRCDGPLPGLGFQ